MKKFLFYTITIFAAITIIAAKKKPTKILLAGDSTMADKEEIAYPETGWGQVLPSYFDDEIVIENHARNGRSTRTFISEGRWDYLLSHTNKGDFVIIQFGHNDQSIKKADRYTTPEDFKKNFARFVDDVKAKGATPILCTPVMRRKFSKNGNFIDQHGNYPNLIRQVAKEKNVLLIDMQHLSMDFLIGAGVEDSKKYFLHVKPGECKKHPDGKEDNTHFKPDGAMEMAKLFVEQLKANNVKQLVKHLRDDEKVTLTYTTQLPKIKKMKSNTNNKLDEGEKNAPQVK